MIHNEETKRKDRTRSMKVRSRVSNGATYLEVISAQQALLASQLTKVVDDFNKMQAVVNLYYALGGEQ